MFSEPLSFLERTAATALRRAAGMNSGGPGLVPLDETAASVFVAAIMGAFCGLLVGLILHHVLRFMSMFTGHSIARTPLAFGSLAVGTAVFVVLALVTDEE